MHDATLCFLIKESQNKITEICLAMKKRGFGKDRWNGVGGKVQTNESETIEQALIRETQEEIGVDIKDFSKVAELDFHFPHQPDWDQKVHTYFCRDWSGEPRESDEMAPQWFNSAELPYDKMWPDDKFWVPQVLNKKLLEAQFTFGEGDVVLDKQVRIVDSL